MRADAKRNRSRILAEAAAVFAEKGASASTEEVAARAGVAIGTVFRHFPTKRDLLQAIVKDLLESLTEEAATLAADGDPATSLFDFFRHMVAQAAAKKTVADLLAADTGVQLEVSGPVLTLSTAVRTLLSRAQHSGAVDPAVRLDEVMALLTATCQGALACRLVPRPPGTYPHHRLRRPTRPGLASALLSRSRRGDVVDRDLLGPGPPHAFGPPFPQRGQCGVERDAVLGQGVLDLRWHLAVHLTMHEPVFFHLAQMLNQHLLADAWQTAPELGEPADAVMVQFPEDQRLPLAGDHVHRRVDAADVGPSSSC